MGSFADELRAKTKTNTQIEEEKTAEERRKFNDKVQYNYKRVRQLCEKAAALGNRSVKCRTVRDYVDADNCTIPDLYRSEAEANSMAKTLAHFLSRDGLTTSCSVEKEYKVIKEKHLFGYKEVKKFQGNYFVEVTVSW